MKLKPCGASATQSVNEVPRAFDRGIAQTRPKEMSPAAKWVIVRLRAPILKAFV